MEMGGAEGGSRMPNGEGLDGQTGDGEGGRQDRSKGAFEPGGVVTLRDADGNEARGWVSEEGGIVEVDWSTVKTLDEVMKEIIERAAKNVRKILDD